MNKKNEKKIVKIAEEEVYKFVKEWKENPYLWDSEADVHVGGLHMAEGGFLVKFDGKEITRCYAVSVDYDE